MKNVKCTAHLWTITYGNVIIILEKGEYSKRFSFYLSYNFGAVVPKTY